MTIAPKLPPLPPAFVARMRALLGPEASAFFSSYERPPVAGLRVNTGKVDPAHFMTMSPWPLTPVPWCEAGYVVGEEVRPGRHPWHAAGLFYLQEPSAMAVAEALGVRPGHVVLDLAAAPGGKATHIASLLHGEGLLVANEVVPGRVKALGENLERWGAANVVLLNEDPARLAERLGPLFDRVLLDAPCSGEGMFRKSPVALREWSPEHVGGSAARQAKILAEAARLVRPGGRLLYSTCTFAPEENEGQIARFLAAHPGWALVDIPKRDGIAPGCPAWTGAPEPPPLERAARLWPHRLAGEGHFLALLERPPDDAIGAPQAAPSASKRAPRHARDAATSVAALADWQTFAADSLTGPWAAILPDRLIEHGGHLFLRPQRALPLDGLRVVRPGLMLGTAKPGRFVASHALALALAREAARRTLDLSAAEAERYLAGEPLAALGAPGWTLVTVAGFPLGWGRRSGEVVKNHYPKGLRRAGG